MRTLTSNTLRRPYDTPSCSVLHFCQESATMMTGSVSEPNSSSENWTIDGFDFDFGLL